MKKVNRHRNAPKSLKMMIIRLPNSTDFDNIDPDLKADLDAGLTVFGGQVAGSKVYTSKIVIICLTYLSKGDMTSLLSKHGVTWTILATEGVKIVQTQLLKFMSDVNIYDENGNITGTTPVTDVTGILQTYAGHEWNF